MTRTPRHRVKQILKGKLTETPKALPIFNGMKKVLAFRHVPHEGLGTIEPFLKDLQVQIDYRDLFLKNTVPANPFEYDFIISMGGPMNADEIERYPFLLEERNFIARAIQGNVPMLGICLGSQIMARALGARVYAGAQKEIGWHSIQWTEEAVKDFELHPIFRSEPVVFHWHGDTFDLPEKAVLLASSALFKNQAFRFGRHAYALQFHIEVTPDMIQDWIAKGEAELNLEKQPISKTNILDAIPRHAAFLKQAADPIYTKIFSPVMAKQGNQLI